MNEVFLAEIIAPHALKGVMKVRVEDENPQRFTPGRAVYIKSEGGYLDAQVQHYQSQGRYGLLKLDIFDSATQVEHYRGCAIIDDEKRLPALPEGVYYVHELQGLALRDASGKTYGTIEDVLNYPTNDVYVVRRDDGRTELVPVIPTVIESIHIDEGYVRYIPMRGLFDED